jgi:hypothetical protein
VTRRSPEEKFPDKKKITYSSLSMSRGKISVTKSSPEKKIPCSKNNYVLEFVDVKRKDLGDEKFSRKKNSLLKKKLRTRIRRCQERKDLGDRGEGGQVVLTLHGAPAKI